MKLLLTVAALCIVILLLVARRINSRENWSQPHCFGDKQIHASGCCTDPCRQCEYFSECIRITRTRSDGE